MAKSKRARLSDDQKTAIKNAPAGTTLAELAKQHNTSINTVARYRSGGAKRASSPSQAQTRRSARRPQRSSGNGIDRIDAVRQVLRMGDVDANVRLKMIEAFVA